MTERKFNRRDFLKGLVNGGAAITLGGYIPRTEAEEVEEKLVISERLWRGDKELPLWLIGTWGDRGDNFIVSAVVSGEPAYKGKETGRDINELLYNKDFKSATEEITVPVAFQNPQSGKFYNLNLSFGNRDIIAKTGMINLENGQFLEASSTRGGYDVYRGSTANYMVSKQELFSRLRRGEQIAFSLPTSKEALYGYLPSQAMQTILNRVGKDSYFQKLEEEAVSNNVNIVEAMQKNQELPKLTIYSSQFFMRH